MKSSGCISLIPLKMHKMLFIQTMASTNLFRDLKWFRCLNIF